MFVGAIGQSGATSYLTLRVATRQPADASIEPVRAAETVEGGPTEEVSWQQLLQSVTAMLGPYATGMFTPPASADVRTAPERDSADQAAPAASDGQPALVRIEAEDTERHNRAAAAATVHAEAETRNAEYASIAGAMTRQPTAFDAAAAILRQLVMAEARRPDAPVSVKPIEAKAQRQNPTNDRAARPTTVRRTSAPASQRQAPRPIYLNALA